MGGEVHAFARLHQPPVAPPIPYARGASSVATRLALAPPLARNRARNMGASMMVAVPLARIVTTHNNNRRRL